MKKREFFLQDDQSNKFWTIEVDGDAVVTTNGRIGAKPRETRTGHGSHEAAVREAEKEILGKRRKGYLEGPLADVPEYAKGLPPRFVRINHDEHDARYVGRTAGGDQFFLTFPFVPRIGKETGGSYTALYLFDEFGLLKDAKIFSDHEQGLTTETAAEAFTESLLQGLGKVRFGDIKVAPFAIERFGHTFGLVFDPGDGEEEDDEEPYTCVTVEPGNYMAFSPPWDGEYDT